MAIIRSKELKGYSPEQLKSKLSELKLESIKAHKPSHGSSIKTREVRRTVARILTLMGARKMAAKESESVKTIKGDKTKQ